MFFEVVRRIRQIAMWTRSNPNRHQFAVNASMIFQLFRVLEGFLAMIAFEIFCVRMDFHVGIFEARQYWCLESAIGVRATVEFQIDRVFAPHVRRQCIVNPFLWCFVCVNFAFRATKFGVCVGGVVALFMHRQHIFRRKTHRAVVDAAFERKIAHL